MDSDNPPQQQTTVPFKPPPTTLCLCAPDSCLSRGQKLHSPSHICNSCLTRHDPHHLLQVASSTNNHPTALSLINTEVSRKQQLKANLEARGKFLCAFEDPDYVGCEWRGEEFNLKGTRPMGECGVVTRKGKACEKCWRGWGDKVGVMGFFTAWGVVWDEAGQGESSGEVLDEEEDASEGAEEYGRRKRVRVKETVGGGSAGLSAEEDRRAEGGSSGAGAAPKGMDDEDDDDDDVEGYNTILG